MAATVLSFRPPASLRASRLFSVLGEKVQQIVQQSTLLKAGAAESSSDIWALYRMAGAHDSVSPAVTRKLSELAASK